MPAPQPLPGKLTGKTVSWYERSGLYSNRVCLYCGTAVGGPDDAPSNKEHLIGRNFVPLGTLGSSAFNFLFRACEKCNERKGVAERHVSSVTLLNGPGRHEDPRAADAAERKASRDFHPDKPGVAMGHAQDHMTISWAHAGLSVATGFAGPPRANDAAVQQLALNQVQALFTLLTTRDFRDLSTMRLLPPENVALLGSYGRSDWGHPHLIEVARRAASWPCHANVVSADGYFKAVMSRHESKGWFWALEWNKFLRVAGGIVRDDMSLFENLPDEKWFSVPGSGDRARVEVPLEDDADTLFNGTVEDSFL